MCQNIKKLWSYQKDVKLSKRCQMSKHQTHGLWRRFTKKMNWHNEVHTHWCQFWCPIWSSPKTLKMCIESVFEQFWWSSYLTSKLMSICVNLIMWIYFFVNLLHSPYVWLFDIWHLFDNLTSFWQLEIFWYLTGPPHSSKEKYFLKSPRKVHPPDQGRYPPPSKGKYPQLR